jgi:hypothetical protein
MLNPGLPRPLVVSAVSTNLGALRQHWKMAGEEAERPLGVRGGDGKPVVDLGGALLRTATARSVPHNMAGAMAPDGESLLVTSAWSVARLSRDLDTMDADVWPLPLLNAVHWLSATDNGWLVVSSGIDLIFEVDRSGRVIWEWWAMDHGFDTDPLGRRRQLDRDADHRGIDYGTIANTSHVNSAVRLSDGSTLASLFHQGQLVLIEPDGQTHVLVDELDHPHAVRCLPDRRVSVANTGRGEVLIFDWARGPCSVRGLPASTDWLQDAYWDETHLGWILTDGRNSSTTWVPATAPEDADWEGRRTYQHDTDWRIYAAIPDPWG